MNLKSLFYPMVLVASATFAQPAPVITSISPVSGPSSGGTVVTITGENLDPAVVCALPCPTTVTFGTITVPVAEESPQRLVVVTPAHAPGVVDVTIDVPGREPSRNPDAFTFTPGAEDAWERVLFPVYVDGTVDGGHGSAWESQLWIRNAGAESIQLAPWPCTAEVCLPVVPNPYTLQPGASLHNLPPHFTPPSANPGRLLYVQRDGAAGMRYSLRTADVSRAVENAGTELPVVRDSELHTGVIDLMNVPMTDSFRVLLRVYEMAYTSASFVVTVYPQTTEASNPVHSFALVATTVQSGEFRTQPASAQFDLTELLQLDDHTWPDSVRIEIRPETPGSRYWAFASITNNTTQLVTTSTPQ